MSATARTPPPGDPAASERARPGRRAALTERWLPKLLLGPSILVSLVFVHGFILLTAYLSLTDSRLLPSYRFVGLERYRELFANEHWWTAAANLAWFGIPFIGACVGLGLLLAILLDQKIRAEGVLRAIYVYPLALSLIVTGVVWQWILNPGLGVGQLLRDWGFEDVSIGWLGDPDKAIFCVVAAAVWQSKVLIVMWHRISSTEKKTGRMVGMTTWR